MWVRAPLGSPPCCTNDRVLVQFNTMKPPLDKLYKFLRLEVERGFDDRAVLGGLRNILDSWEAEARAADLPNILIQAVTARLRDYHQLTPASREEILRGLWRRVQRSLPDMPELFADTPARAHSPSSPAVADRRPPQAAPPARSQDTAPTRPRPVLASAPPPPAVPTPTAQSEQAAEPTPTEPAPEPAPAMAEAAGPALGEQAEEAQEASEPRGAEPESEETHEPAAAESPGAGRVRRYSIPPAVAAEDAAALNAPLTVISGIGPKISERLAVLGIQSLGDALTFFPRRYDDYSRLEPINRLMYGQTVTVIGAVEQVQMRPTRSGRKVVEALISDGSGAIRATWFNQPWLVEQLREAGNVSLSGRIDQYLGRLVLNSPDWEALESRNLHTRRIVPIYPLTGDISQKWLRGKIKEIVDYWAARVQEPLPPALIERAGLMPVSTALRQIHYPDSWEDLAAAQHRLAFDELFTLQIAVFLQRRRWTERTGTRFEVPDEWFAAQTGSLPYSLTGAQQAALQDIRSDLQSGRPMNRLLQGDVGSGKTAVAALAASMVAYGGAQIALMAPTSILAEQHYRSIAALVGHEAGSIAPEEIALLVGATPESEKERIRRGLAEGMLKLVIGTHALLEPDVSFRNLELVVIDEQHRFGVRQRGVLREKGSNPHLLVMTATPIPRSLALTVYGDLDLSVIGELPPGRQQIGTHLLRPVERERAYTLIRREIENGRQAFIIYPLIEESETSEARAAVEEHARLQRDIFPKQSVGLLHGRLGAEEKETVMAAFRDGQIHILVSTAVVEVGVDVPNATVMVIEGANRFGLSQLHQFRGRVGRGAERSYCLLIPDHDDAVENERLQAMVETNDGFILAEKDLAQRGPGQFLGTQQSGYSSLKLASITDVRLVEKARRFAQELVAADPDLEDPAHALIAEQAGQIWSQKEGDVS